MMESTSPLKERMTLFWHNHFASRCIRNPCMVWVDLPTYESHILKSVFRHIIFLAASLLALGAFAQDGSAVPVQNLVNLSASATVEVAQDWLTLNMTTTRDGTDAGKVQTQLKTALDSALTEARKASKPGEMDVHTGNFNLRPRYDRDGKISGWQGSVELVLEGQDIQRISQTAGRIQTLTMGQMRFGLSRAQLAKAQSEAQALAIENFKSRANEIARGFGFERYSLREVSIQMGNSAEPPRPLMMAKAMRSSAEDAPVPVEAGKSVVEVSVSGSVQIK